MRFEEHWPTNETRSGKAGHLTQSMINAKKNTLSAYLGQANASIFI
jgi:hypothetical protein